MSPSLWLLLFIVHVISAQKNYLWQPKKTTSKTIELRVVKHVADIRNKSGDIIAYVTIRAYEYNGETHFIGPTIVAKPGDTIDVTLINDIKGVGRIQAINASLGAEGYKDPDVTNLHTHGLHVNPNQDDVLKYASPKCTEHPDVQNDLGKLDCYSASDPTTHHVINSINYHYHIPETHYPGTHWYHAHHHGSVTYDVIQGQYGLFIIEPSDEYAANAPSNFMEEVQLLIGYAWLHNYTECINQAGIDSWTNLGGGCAEPKYRRPTYASAQYPFAFPVQSACLVYCNMKVEAGGFFIDGPNAPVKYSQVGLSEIPEYPVNITTPIPPDGVPLFFVNGQVRPYIAMTHNKWYHFRMVNTVMNYLLFWVKDDIVAGNCSMWVMGRDGVYFNKSRNLYEAPYQNRTIVIQPGSRADVAVRCDCAVSDSPCNYEIWGSSSFKDDDFIPVPRNDTELFTMEVTAERNIFPNETDNRFFEWEPQPHSSTPYLQETFTKEADAFCAPGGYESGEMSQCNIVHGRIAYPAKKGSGTHFTAMNQVVFNPGKHLSNICVGNTREWTVTSNWHPFHHHTWPFQLQTDITDGWIAMKGDWRDTLGAPGTFRMRSNYVKETGFTNGSLIMHCHFVPHEDHGMMVQVALNPPQYCHNFSYIVPSYEESNHDTVNISNKTSILVAPCPAQSATATVRFADVNADLTINLDLTEDCYSEFSFQLTPRTVTVGNLWIGFGNGDNFDYKDPYRNPPIMIGNALIVSLLASSDGQSPLHRVTAMEVELNNLLRSSKIVDNTFDCHYGELTVDDFGRSWKCRRPRCSDGAFCNFETDSNFIIAYGEGQFRANETYHSSRGQCAFSFITDIACTISQGQVEYDDITAIPTASPTAPSAAPTNFYTTIEPPTNESKANILSHFVSFIVFVLVIVFYVKL